MRRASSHRSRRWLTAVVVLAAGLVIPGSALAAGQFTFLQAGFTQELYGTQPTFMGGVAFAPDGDPITDDCAFGGSAIRRFDKQTTLPPQNGTSTLHPRTDKNSNAGCGLTQAGGFLFSNTSGGVTKLDPDTGAQVDIGGPGGNALGITVDPTNQNLVYVGGDGTLWSIDQGLNTPIVFSNALTGHFLDGIFFSPDGQFLFVADRQGGPGFQVTVLRHNGTLVQSIPTGNNEPDGIAFHATSPKFVVAGNTNGTMTRFDFPGDDYTQPPAQSVFASGGFRSDLSQVGNDGCLYQSQAGTRYDNGTTDGNNSLVRICPGFAPAAGVEGPPGAANCSNHVDDDGDNLIDQADPDCQSAEGPPGSASCSDGVDNDNDGQTDAADSGCQAANGVPGRMVTNATKSGVKYASIVDCDAATANSKNRPFTVQWTDGGATKTYKSSTFSNVVCFDDPSKPGVRPAGFDRQTGQSTGTLNGASGYRLIFDVYDGGTGANVDEINLRVEKISDGSVQKSLSGTLASGTSHSALTP